MATSKENSTIDKLLIKTYKNVNPFFKALFKEEKPKVQRRTQHTTRKKEYMDYINDLVKINEKYPYTYISNLKYSEKTYQAFRNAMEIKSATPIDLFVHSITFRAEAINSGYLALVEQGNYLCAMALIRMQVDNFLTAWAGLACKDRDKFFVYYNSGKPINKLTDKDNNNLTQGYIVNSYAEVDPLIREIYKDGNDYIHPSHVFQEESVDLTSGIRMLSYKDYECSEELKKEAKKHMLVANNVLANILCRWVQLKHGIDLGVSNMEAL